MRALLPEPGRRERLEEELEASEGGPLDGVLLAVKDVFAVNGLEMRCGSALPAALFDWPEASSVTRLRAAGCLVVGKAVTAEFACLDPNGTANPRDVTRTPGGSSSGSAAAVAAGYADVALGTQTVGSILRPAAYCGIVGYKPTLGRVPTDGILAYAPSVDCPGLLAADLDVAERTAAVLVPEWSGAPAVSAVRLAVPDGPYLDVAEDATREAFDARLDALQAAGVEVVRVPALLDWDELVDVNLRLTNAELADSHAPWFDAWAPLYRPTVATCVLAGRQVRPAEREECLAKRARTTEVLERALAEAGADAWVSPATTGPPPVGLRATGSPAMNMPWTFAGLPALALPSGGAVDAPLTGLQLASPRGSDERLFGIARHVARALASSAS